MQVEHKEIAKVDSNCEIRLGTASWDNGSGNSKSIKYTWFDKNGKAHVVVNFQLKHYLKRCVLQFAKVM